MPSIGSVLPVAFTMLFLAGTLVAEKQHNQRLKWICKPLASAGFIWTALAAGAWGSTYGQVILVGLVLSWLGDVLLIPEGSKKAFLFGLVSFLLAHVAFAGAFLVHGVAPLWLLALVPLAGVAVPFHRWLAPKIPQKLKIPVLVYMAVITVMVTLASGAWGAGAAWLVPVGAFVFWLSDISVALDRFAGFGFGNRAWGLPAYYGAQILLAWST